MFGLKGEPHGSIGVHNTRSSSLNQQYNLPFAPPVTREATLYLRQAASRVKIKFVAYINSHILDSFIEENSK